jgi:hypothetical protein
MFYIYINGILCIIFLIYFNKKYLLYRENWNHEQIECLSFKNINHTFVKNNSKICLFIVTDAVNLLMFM